MYMLLKILNFGHSILHADKTLNKNPEPVRAVIMS